MSDTPAFPTEKVVHLGHGATRTERTGGMTLRQYAAIKLKVPDSGDPWLDDMIRKSLRQDIAGRAIILKFRERGSSLSFPEFSKVCYELADAMLKARDVK